MAKKNDSQKMISEVPPVGDESPAKNEWLETRISDAPAKTQVPQTSVPVAKRENVASIPQYHTQANSQITIDVRRQGFEIKSGVFRLQNFVDGAEYKDVLNNRYIWSIGRNLHDGRVEAAIDTRYYGDPNWECLFLR